MIFDISALQNVRRFKLVSISTSLDFYLALGFIYWGVNSVGDYYCNLPVPKNGLTGLVAMTKSTDMNMLVGRHGHEISEKVKGNNLKLDKAKSKIYEKDKTKMRNNYRLNDLDNYNQVQS